MKNRRELLKKLNLKSISDETNISYNVLKNYSSGRKKELSNEQIKEIEVYLSNFIKNFF